MITMKEMIDIELKSISNTARTDSAFDGWLAQMVMRLDHPDAIACTAGNPGFAGESLQIWRGLGYDPEGMAEMLNHQYRTGYLEKKLQMIVSK